MEKSMPIAIGAVVISVVAIASAFVLRPTLAIGAGDIGTDELADDSVTGDKIVDGTITDADISTAGISRIATGAVGSGQIADNSIALQDLSSDVADLVTGVENIADNSITSAKIVDGTIVDVDIAAAGISRIATDAVTNANILDGTITDADISPAGISRIADDSITSAKLAENSVDNAELRLKIKWGEVNLLGGAGTVVNHELPGTPVAVFVTPVKDLALYDNLSVSVYNIGATQFTVDVILDGAAWTGTVYWMALYYT